MFLIEIFTNIGSYLNMGLLMMLAGLILLIIGLVNLAGYMGRSWEVSVSEFNQRFLHETGMDPGQVNVAAERLDLARRLHIDTMPTGATVTQMSGDPSRLRTEMLDDTEPLGDAEALSPYDKTEEL